MPDIASIFAAQSGARAAERAERAWRSDEQQEVAVNWSKWVRQIHRWLSMAFTAAVIVNIVAVATGRYANWVGFLAVLPLAFLLLTGLYLFVLPYAARRRLGHARRYPQQYPQTRSGRTRIRNADVRGPRMVHGIGNAQERPLREEFERGYRR
jgi:Cytochrome b subunit of the bc complex